MPWSSAFDVLHRPWWGGVSVEVTVTAAVVAPTAGRRGRRGGRAGVADPARRLPLPEPHPARPGASTAALPVHRADRGAGAGPEPGPPAPSISRVDRPAPARG